MSGPSWTGRTIRGWSRAPKVYADTLLLCRFDFYGESSFVLVRKSSWEMGRELLNLFLPDGTEAGLRVNRRARTSSSAGPVDRSYLTPVEATAPAGEGR